MPMQHATVSTSAHARTPARSPRDLRGRPRGRRSLPASCPAHVSAQCEPRRRERPRATLSPGRRRQIRSRPCVPPLIPPFVSRPSGRVRAPRSSSAAGRGAMRARFGSSSLVRPCSDASARPRSSPVQADMISDPLCAKKRMLRSQAHEARPGRGRRFHICGLCEAPHPSRHS